MDLETNMSDMNDEELNEILTTAFGITLKSPFRFNSIMQKVQNKK